MSQVILPLKKRDGIMTPEDDYHRDAFRWRFKDITRGPTSIPFLYIEDDSLWANASTRSEVHPPTIGSTNNTVPLFNISHAPIPVRGRQRPPEFTYSEPHHRVVLGVGDMTCAGHYVTPVRIQSHDGLGEAFEAHADTCSPTSWLCSFDGSSGPERYNLDIGSKVGGSVFKAAYVDQGEVSGPLYQAAASFGDESFTFKWTFGVATWANEYMLQSHLSQGILALSWERTPDDGPNSVIPKASCPTFIEQLLRAHLIKKNYFCIKVTALQGGTITFGELPEIGDRKFRFERVVAGEWALKSPYIEVVVDGKTSRLSFNTQTEQEKITRPQPTNVAMFDLGTAGIYLRAEAVEWLYDTLCGPRNFFDADGAYYIKESIAKALKYHQVHIVTGERVVVLPATVIVGDYSHEYKAYIGTVQAKGGPGAGLSIDTSEWTYDLYGTAFFKYVLIAFDAHMVYPKIAICGNTDLENAREF